MNKISLVTICRLFPLRRINIQNFRTVPSRKLPLLKTEKRLDIVILGPPNVGKSVLLNTLLHVKLAATSRKKHTTRKEILGVFNHRNVQLAFYDTPGFVGQQHAVNPGVQSIRNVSFAAVSKADVVLLVVDSSHKITKQYQDVFAELAKLALDNAKIEIILVLNKVDLVNPKTNLLETTKQLVSLINGVKLRPEEAHLAELDTTTFMISALENDGVIDLKNYLISIAPQRSWMIGKEEGITSLSKEERVEQIVLEALLDHTHQEIPYVADIRCKTIVDVSPTVLRIDADVLVDTSGQQRIVIGHKGRTLVKVRQAAVEILEKIFSKKVLLYIWVNLRKSGNQAEAPIAPL